MRYRKLGKTEAEVSEIGFGAWGIGGSQWLGGKDEESERALRRAFELGVTFIDTALAYGEGHSERLVGKAVKSSFQRIYVATKVPPKNRIWPASPAMPISEVFPYDYIIESTNQSLAILEWNRFIYNSSILDRRLGRAGRVAAGGRIPEA